MTLTPEFLFFLPAVFGSSLPIPRKLDSLFSFWLKLTWKSYLFFSARSFFLINQNGDSKIIGILNEGELHAALKLHYGGEGARYEEKIQGFVVDVVRDGVVYEIETSSLSGKERKYRELSEHNEVVLVYPIALKTTLVHEQDGETVRKISPK